ncbi:MAG: hypothetical protein U5Q03_02810 [Bacteroidota bacterium]|nr:hypothetical protein [Bacteroidota bacterium]
MFYLKEAFYGQMYQKAETLFSNGDPDDPPPDPGNPDDPPDDTNNPPDPPPPKS